MIGPGRYDNLAQEALETTQAKGVILVVLEGNLGSGCSCKLTLMDQLKIPKILRCLANDIEERFIKGEL